MAQLEVTRGGSKGKRIELSETTVIGRSPRVDVQLDDVAVSQIHARLTLRRGTYYLADQNSTNGTRLNGQPVREPTALSDGDVIALGSSRLEFSEDADVAQSRGIVEDDPEGERAILAEVDTAHPVSGVLSVLGNELDEAQQLRRHLEHFYEVSTAISRTLDQDDLLATVLVGLFDALPNAERGVILVSDDAGESLAPRISKDRTWRDVVVPVSATMIDTAIDSDRGILSLDPVRDERFAGSKTVASLTMRSVICIPLVVDEHVQGILQVDSSAIAAPLSKADLALAAGIAGLLALALANGRLHDRLLTQELVRKDLALARKVQQHFLPSRPPAVEGFSFELQYQPALEVGGDYYDFLVMGGGQLGVAVGDASGKGVSAALYMARVSSEARYVAAGKQDPGAVLSELNALLLQMSSEGMFMTLAIVTVGEGKCSLANAGHCPPLLRRASGEVDVLAESIGPALGVDDLARYRSCEIAFEPGDCLLLLTDGVAEAQSAQGGFYGQQRLVETVGRADGAPGALVSAIHESVARFQGDTPAADDLTIVAIGRT